MTDIKWKEGAVCFATHEQRFANKDDVYIVTNSESTVSFNESRVTCSNDFQLNEIRQGDYIEASELDTEQKYNDVVEAFGLFGFENGVDGLSYAEHLNYAYDALFIDVAGEIDSVTGKGAYAQHCKRKLTYPQLMAIGKLKRAMIERDESHVELSVDGGEMRLNSNSSESPNSCEGEWTDKHYDNFYHLTEEDIKTGQIKIDAYFVNRMWKINQWDDTGAGFHVLKTLPRIANNKNPLKRELVALKKQVDLLCQMHGVNKEDF